MTSTSNTAKTRHIDFGFSDSAGRRVGLVAHIVSVVLAPTDWRVIQLGVAAGAHISVTASVTRNAKEFGVTPRPQYFATAEQVEQYIAGRAETAKARYAKLAHAAR